LYVLQVSAVGHTSLVRATFAIATVIAAATTATSTTATATATTAAVAAAAVTVPRARGQVLFAYVCMYMCI